MCPRGAAATLSMARLTRSDRTLRSPGPSIRSWFERAPHATQTCTHAWPGLSAFWSGKCLGHENTALMLDRDTVYRMSEFQRPSPAHRRCFAMQASSRLCLTTSNRLQVNKACREIESDGNRFPSEPGGEFGRVMSTMSEEGKPWWHTQLQTQLSHARIEVIPLPLPTCNTMGKSTPPFHAGPRADFLKYSSR